MKNSYEAKAAFFDGQVRAQWAADAYGLEEERKLDHLFKVTGPLTGLRLLEPGCGTGRLTAVLAEKAGPTGKVVAIDISPGMIAETRRRVAGLQNVEILMGAAEEQVGFIGKFHMIICHQVFPHFDKPGNALGKFAMMLHPGGKIVISHFMGSAEINAVHRKAHAAVAHDMLPPIEKIREWCSRYNLAIQSWCDSNKGYFFRAALNE